MLPNDSHALTVGAAFSASLPHVRYDRSVKRQCTRRERGKGHLDVAGEGTDDKYPDGQGFSQGCSSFIFHTFSLSCLMLSTIIVCAAHNATPCSRSLAVARQAVCVWVPTWRVGWMDGCDINIHTERGVGYKLMFYDEPATEVLQRP